MVAGKGGVGKTTVTAAIARAASRSGLRVLVVELDGKPMLAELVPDLEVLSIAASDALDDYLREHGFGRIATRLNKTGVIDVIGTAAPGIDDIVVLGKIKQLERSGDYDLIVVDGPAAGHAITFLTAAAGLAESVRSGPIRSQADDVLEMLHDPKRCQVVLVSLPEATPVNELIETAFALEDQVGVQLGPVVLNGVDDAPPLPGSRGHGRCGRGSRCGDGCAVGRRGRLPSGPGRHAGRRAEAADRRPPAPGRRAARPARRRPGTERHRRIGRPVDR